MAENEALVERVARVLAKADGKDPDAPAWVKFPGDPYGICWRDQYADKARAVLTSLAPAPDREGETPFDWSLSDGTKPSLVCEACGNHVPVTTHGKCSQCAIKGDDTLSIRAREMLAAELPNDTLSKRRLLRGPPYGAGAVSLAQAIRAVERALSTGEA